jgi:hypothetical protein
VPTKSSRVFPTAIVLKQPVQMESIVQFALVRWKNLLVVIIGLLRSDLNPKYFEVSSAIYSLMEAIASPKSVEIFVFYLPMMSHRRIEAGGRLELFEAKWMELPDLGDTVNLDSVRNVIGKSQVTAGGVVSRTPNSSPFPSGFRALPVTELG